MNTTLPHPAPMPDYELIETFRFEPYSGFLRLDQHLQRIHNSAAQLGFSFNEARIREKLKPFENSDQALRMRLTLSPDGITSITHTPYVPLPISTLWRLAIAETRINSNDPLLRHKTTHREIYNIARAEFSANEVDEVLLLNEKDEICEGTITSLFVELRDATNITPPLECGLLNGILRQELLAKGVVTTGKITVQDLQTANKIFIGNSLRGIIPAKLVV